MPDYRQHKVLALQDLLSKGASIGAEAASQQRQERSALERLVKGQEADMAKMARAQEMKEAADQAARQRNMETFQALKAANPKAAVSVTADGGVSVNPEDDWMKRAMFEQRNQGRVDSQVAEIGKRVEKEDIPAVVGQFQEIDRALPEEGKPLKSVGPWANVIPDMLVPLAEKAGILEKGAAQERAAFGMAKTLTRHPLFGASLTPTEKADAESNLGLPMGGTEEQALATLNRMRQVPLSKMGNIEASSNPSALSEYQGRPGSVSSQGIAGLLKRRTAAPGAGSPPAGDGNANADQDARIQRLQELRKKYGRTN